MASYVEQWFALMKMRTSGRGNMVILSANFADHDFVGLSTLLREWKINFSKKTIKMDQLHFFESNGDYSLHHHIEGEPVELHPGVVWMVSRKRRKHDKIILVKEEVTVKSWINTYLRHGNTGDGSDCISQGMIHLEIIWPLVTTALTSHIHIKGLLDIIKSYHS